MWKSLGEGVLRFRWMLLGILLAITIFMGWQASQVKLSYEFSRAIPTDNPKYRDYQAFRKTFGEDGNLMVIGVQTKRFFEKAFFDDYTRLQEAIKEVSGVESILSVPGAVTLVKNEATEKLEPRALFTDSLTSQARLDTAAAQFLNLPFYQGLLYNPTTHAWLMGVSINSSVLTSPKRKEVIPAIVKLVEAFGQRQKVEMHLSGLPLIRTQVATKIEKEMRFFTVGSLALSALILLLFFRSLSATALSLAVVIIGVIWSFGTVNLLGYKITLLTALIPPLVVVIGIPNCIYFLNKYHTAYKETGDKRGALVQMIAKMGVVTLFCNIAAAIGFGVFALTKSQILQEFGLVAGINIFLLFFISLIFIPAILSITAAPKERHIKYLQNRMLQNWLTRVEHWSLHHRSIIYIATAVVVMFSVAGMFRLKSVGYIVDDLPKTDKIYTDLRFFEDQFGGVMPLEIVVDTKQPNGIRKHMLPTFNGIDSLSAYLASRPYMAKPMNVVEGLKFAKQAFFEGDSTQYSMPSEYDLPALAQYISIKGDTAASKSSFSRLVTRFIDSTKQQTRISASMKDVGSERLFFILDSIQDRANQLFDTSRYAVRLTGSSVTFLEGSRFIINGLKESIFWAFLLIAACMLYLFRSLRILLCSLIPNLIPLVITAGVMGWVGVPLKPSTVLVFSVTLGIAIDVTIRFLVNYKQQAKTAGSVQENVVETIHSTGLSIIYTSFVLIAGFVIFCFSGFGGTQALGWLTSLTLVVATVANLTLLPALLISLSGKKAKF
ncbi:MAG: transporter [Flaviaesturariibacter sp.]|nr:transporter [Flaviaesturariibacter sp.]